MKFDVFSLKNVILD